MHLASVPLNIELTNLISNSKFAENSCPPNFNNSRPIITKFGTRHDSTTVVTCTKFRYDRPTILERTVIWISSKIWIWSNLVNSIFSGTGTRPVLTRWYRIKRTAGNWLIGPAHWPAHHFHILWAHASTGLGIHYSVFSCAGTPIFDEIVTNITYLSGWYFAGNMLSRFRVCTY